MDLCTPLVLNLERRKLVKRILKSILSLYQILVFAYFIQPYPAAPYSRERAYKIDKDLNRTTVVIPTDLYRMLIP